MASVSICPLKKKSRIRTHTHPHTKERHDAIAKIN